VSAAALLAWLVPWEPSPTVMVLSAGAALGWLRGQRRLAARGRAPSAGRRLAFWSGLALTYLFLHSHLDYLSQHMFWIHRLQHLVLHHLGPFLVMLAVPHEVIGAALPGRLRERVLAPLWRSPWLRWPYRLIQHPVPATALFAGLVYLWLDPEIHFDAMLSEARYKAMNWSMTADGLLFWWLILDPRPAHAGRTLAYGVRIVMLWAAMVAQIAIGAYITLSSEVLYDAYAICGRAWPLDPLTDQQLGGLLTWIPPSMMSVVGILVVLRMWMHAGSGSRAGEPGRGGAPGGERA